MEPVVAKPVVGQRSTVGMWIGPPKALDWPKPMSSIRMSTLGAPFGALTSNRGGAFALRASSSVIVGGGGSGMGSTVRSSASLWANAGALTKTATSAGASARKLRFKVSSDSVKPMAWLRLS